MAVTKITYENKEAIQNDASVANKSKVTDDDMNEIKKVVNNNADEVTGMQENIEDLQDGQGSANADITSLKNRVNTLESNVSNLENNKVDKIEGKSLSTEDFTTELKTKLEGLNNYDDTDIKEEQIQQNKNIENLQTNDSKQDLLISKLKNVALNAKTEEAKSIHVEDANKFGSLEVLGNHEQETREGKNLYNLNDVSDKSSGVVVDEDDWIEISFNETKQDVTYMNYMLKPSNKLKTNSTYYLILEIKELSGSGNLNVSQYLDSSKSQIETSISRAFSDLSVGIKKYTVTTIDDFSDIDYMIRTFASFNIGQTGKIVFRLSLLEQDIDASNFKYEKYGASPSINYPSKIVCLGSNKQLLNIFSNRNAGDIVTRNGIKFTVNEDGTVTANGTATGLAQISFMPNATFRAGTYTIKDATAYIQSEDFNGWFNGLISAQTVTINTDFTITNTYVQVQSGETVNNKIFYPKIEEGTEETSYSPYRTR